MTSKTALYTRQLDNLKSDFSILDAYLKDPSVSDIMINPDGKLFIKGSEGRCNTDKIVDSETTRRIILSTAAMLGVTVNSEQPTLAGVIPSYNCRIQGFIEPRTTAPSLVIRRPSNRVFTLLDYVMDDRLNKKHNDIIYEALMTRKNILIGGGTGTGKTTFLNALINEVAVHRSTDRFYIVEDTPEINCKASDYISVLSDPIHTVESVRDALRSCPDRIVFGELRHGDTALEFLKALNTGHPGGFATVHADSAPKMLNRIVDLISEAIAGRVSYSFIAETVNYCVFLSNEPGRGPYVKELIEVSPVVDGEKFNVSIL